MAFYISQPVQSKAAQHPLLLEKNVQLRTLAPLNLLSIFGRVTEYEVAYAGYVHNIAAFLSATNRGHRLLITAEATGHTIKPTCITWMPLAPPVSFVFKSNIKEARQNTLIAAFPTRGLSFAKSGEYLKAVIKFPNYEIVDALKPFAAKFSRATAEELAIQGWSSFQLLTMLINDFLATNSYAAFFDIDQTEPTAANLEYLDVLNLPKDYVGYGLKKNERNIATAMGGFNLAGIEEEEQMEGDFRFESFAHMREMVSAAKPSPLPSSNNHGPPASLPAQSGLFFPYFHKLIVPDYVTVPKIIGTHFYRYLGATAKNCQEVYDELVSSWPSLTATRAGMILAHVIFGISLALQTQTRLYVLQSGTEYHGFCLLGAKFGVYDGEKMRTPESADDLRSSVRDHCSRHHQALEGIAEMCSGEPLAGTEDYEEVSVGEITGGLSLMKIVSKREWDDEDVEKLQGFLGKVDFGRHYWSIGHQSLVRAVQLLTTEKATPLADDQFPAYAGGDVSLFGSRAYQVLSFFGPNAPSFRNRGGESFKIPLMTEEDVDNQVDEATGKVRMEQMIVSIKKLGEAAKDFEDMVKFGEVRMNQKERASKYRNIIFSGEARKTIWTSLRTYVAPLKPEVQAPIEKEVGSGKKGKKRAGSEDIDEELDNMLKRLRK